MAIDTYTEKPARDKAYARGVHLILTIFSGSGVHASRGEEEKKLN